MVRYAALPHPLRVNPKPRNVCNWAHRYQAFVIETADDGIAVHFSGWSQIWDEFVPASQIETRVRARNMYAELIPRCFFATLCADSLPSLHFCNTFSRYTETGELGPETAEDVRALYSGFTAREQEALRLLRKGGAPPDSALLDASSAESAANITPQDLKIELAEIKESLMATENMLALFVTRHSAVSPDDAKVCSDEVDMYHSISVTFGAGHSRGPSAHAARQAPCQHVSKSTSFPFLLSSVKHHISTACVTWIWYQQSNGDSTLAPAGDPSRFSEKP